MTCKWCDSTNTSGLYTEHSEVGTMIRAKYSNGSARTRVTFCHDCGKITPSGENYYKPETTKGVSS